MVAVPMNQSGVLLFTAGKLLKRKCIYGLIYVRKPHFQVTFCQPEDFWLCSRLSLLQSNAFIGQSYPIIYYFLCTDFKMTPSKYFSAAIRAKPG